VKRILDQVLRHSGRLDAFVDGLMTRKLRGERAPTPAELLSGILTGVERGISVAPDGPVFAYNRVMVDLKVENAERKSELRGVLDKQQIAAAVTRHLERQCRVPPDLRVDLRMQTGDVKAPTYDIEFRNVRGHAETRSAPAAPKTAHLTRMSGGGEPIVLTEGTFNVGRVAEVHGRDGRLMRRNQIILDGDGAGRTVSRAHARIQGTLTDGALVFLLFDDGSRHGSSIVRDGRAHKVHQGTIGMRLHDGDEVYFGDVRLDFSCRQEQGKGADPPS
jgi:hypothetical protein